MIIRLLNMMILVSLVLIVLACDPVFVIQGDINSRITGSSEERKTYKIEEVNVLIKCHRDYIPTGLQTRSDSEGYYRLRGIGIPRECELIFDHPDFKRKTVKLNPDLHKAPDLGWYGYRVNVELEPK